MILDMKDNPLVHSERNSATVRTVFKIIPGCTDGGKRFKTIVILCSRHPINEGMREPEGLRWIDSEESSEVKCS